MPGRSLSAGRAAALLFAGSAAVAVPATEATAMQHATGGAGSVREGEYRSEHGSRRYRLYIPSGPADEGGRPLVVMLHGCTQDAANFAAGTRADAAAERAGALVLYPEQPASAQTQKCWSWYDPAHQGRGSGEPALLAGLTRQVLEDHGADPERVFVAGLSAGGSMAQILAASYPELYRGLAVHSAPAYRSAASVSEARAVMEKGAPEPGALTALLLAEMGSRARAVPTLVIHGAEDAIVRPVNGEQVAAQWRGLAHAVPGDGARVDHVEVPGLGHAWSGGAPEGTYTDPRGPDATAAVFAFFLDPVPTGS